MCHYHYYMSSEYISSELAASERTCAYNINAG